MYCLFIDVFITFPMCGWHARFQYYCDESCTHGRRCTLLPIVRVYRNCLTCEWNTTPTLAVALISISGYVCLSLQRQPRLLATPMSVGRRHHRDESSPRRESTACSSICSSRSQRASGPKTTMPSTRIRQARRKSVNVRTGKDLDATVFIVLGNRVEYMQIFRIRYFPRRALSTTGVLGCPCNLVANSKKVNYDMVYQTSCCLSPPRCKQILIVACDSTSSCMYPSKGREGAYHRNKRAEQHLSLGIETSARNLLSQKQPWGSKRRRTWNIVRVCHRGQEASRRYPGWGGLVIPTRGHELLKGGLVADSASP